MVIRVLRFRQYMREATLTEPSEGSRPGVAGRDAVTKVQGSSFSPVR
jgi:hypothetical protein